MKKTASIISAGILLVTLLVGCPGVLLIPKVDTFTATPATLPAWGGKVRLAWTTTNPDSKSSLSTSIEPGIGSVYGSYRDVDVTASTTFTITTKNQYGSDSAKATVTLTPRTDFTVNSMNDTIDATLGDGICADANNKCSLRAAVMEANADPGADKIILPDGNYDLTIPGQNEDEAKTGDLDIKGELTVEGTSRDKTIISGKGNDRIFAVFGTVTKFDLSKLTLRNGSSSDGGAIYLDGGYTALNATINDVIIENSVATNDGGAVYIGGYTTATIKNTTLQANSATGNGGAIAAPNYYSTNRKIILTAVQVNNNSASNGGGIFGYDYNVSATTFNNNTAKNSGGGLYVRRTDMNNSTITNNTATNKNGGGIFSEDKVAITNSTIDNNNASLGDGGGVYTYSDTTINYSTVSNNKANNGAGMYLSGSNVNIGDTTITNNNAKTNGGGVYLEYAKTTLSASSVIDNQAQNGNSIYFYGSTLSLKTSLLRVLIGKNCTAYSGTVSFNSGNYNLVSDTSCNLGGDHDTISTDIKLGALNNNGGSTKTFLPSKDSPAVDAAPQIYCSTTDQRGITRPQGNGCDIGAVERQASDP